MTLDITVEFAECRCAFCQTVITSAGSRPGNPSGYPTVQPDRMSIIRQSAPGNYRTVYVLDGDIGPAALWQKAQGAGWTEITVFDAKMIACPDCQKKKVSL